MKYLIQDLISHGYWDNQAGSFRGVLYASYFNKSDAKEKAKILSLNGHTVTIIPVYTLK